MSRGRTEQFAASEPIITLGIDGLTATGTVLADMYINPRMMAAPMLAHRALAWTNYKFRKLEIEIVSFFPSSSVGGIVYGLTRDVDAETPNPLAFTKSCEGSINVGLASQRSRFSINCADSMNKMRYYSTFSDEPSDFAQFRMLAVMSQALGGITTTVPITIDIILHYTVEFSGPVTPANPTIALKPASGTTTISVDTDGVVTGYDTTALPEKTGYVYALNPIICKPNTEPIRAVSFSLGTSPSTTTYLYAYATIDAAISNSSPLTTMSGTRSMCAPSICTYVLTRRSAPPPMMKVSEFTQQEYDLIKSMLSTKQGTPPSKIDGTLASSVVVVNAGTPAAEGEANTGPININIVPNVPNIPAHA